MAKKLIHVDKSDVGRLHCDNARCGHTLEQSLPWGPWLIGFTCPRCASDMLTRKDFDKVEAFWRKLAWVNKWFGWLGEEPTDERLKSAPTVRVQIGDGT